tara:strand:- start:1417 stop:1665 length:249 start_codon:yes stop_codon:yes gene_type:complete
MVKKFFKVLWTWSLQDYWVFVWSKTSVDEKAIATVHEIQRRYKLSAAELADIGKAIKEVGNQIGDVGEAIKGNSRRGRPKKK